MRESYDALAVKESKGGGIARSQLIGLQWRKVCRRDPVQFLVANQPGLPSIGGLVNSCLLGLSAKFLRGIASNCWLLRKMGRFFLRLHLLIDSPVGGGLGHQSERRDNLGGPSTCHACRCSFLHEEYYL